MLFQPPNQLAQSKLPSFNSWNNPTNRATKNKENTALLTVTELYEIERTIGNNRINSTSKIRKITATKKNRNEKGDRETENGVNPHSNGLIFSRSK